MPPLFMDAPYEPNSPGSLSAEESNSNTAGSEKEGEGRPATAGRKRRDRNRDAARKTRRKQTERADELHEELQCLERSNSALHKEIASLKKDLHYYTMTLARHEPYCCIQASSGPGPSSAPGPSAECQKSPSPPRLAPQVSGSTVSTSLTSGLGLRSLDCVERTHLSSSASAARTLTSGFSAELVMASASSSAVTLPYPVPLPSLPAPHSLFSEVPVCTGLVSSPIPSGAFTAALPQSGQGAIAEVPLVPASDCFSLDEFLMKQPSFLTAASSVAPAFSHSALPGPVAQGCSMNAPQLHTHQYGGNPNHSRTMSHGQQVAPNPAPLLSLLTVPSPLNIAQTTSNGPDGLTCPAPPSLPPLGDQSADFCLSRLLEVDDWILGGTGNP